MKSVKSILCASILTALLASTTLAGNITILAPPKTDPDKITTQIAGNITILVSIIVTIGG